MTNKSIKKIKKSKISIKNKNINKVNVVIHNSHSKTKRRQYNKKTTSSSSLGNPQQGQMQPIIINSPQQRDESPNELNRMAHNYIQNDIHDIRNNLLLRNELNPQIPLQQIGLPPAPLQILPPPVSSSLGLSVKRPYQKSIHPQSIKQKLGFPDADSYDYLNKIKGLKHLKEFIKKENPNIPENLLKTVNIKNKQDKIREYLQFRKNPIQVNSPLILTSPSHSNFIAPVKKDVSGGGSYIPNHLPNKLPDNLPTQQRVSVVHDLQGNQIYPIPTPTEPTIIKKLRGRPKKESTVNQEPKLVKIRVKNKPKDL